jgi:VanZ family protein
MPAIGFNDNYCSFTRFLFYLSEKYISMIFRTFWKPVCWAVIIIVLSVMPTDELDSHMWSVVPHQDKIMHLIFYVIFTFLLLRAFLIYFKKSKPVWLLVLITFLIILCYGAIIEIIQGRFIASRQGDIMDLVFNLVGSFIAILLVLLVPFFRVSSDIK